MDQPLATTRLWLALLAVLAGCNGGPQSARQTAQLMPNPAPVSPSSPALMPVPTGPIQANVAAVSAVPGRDVDRRVAEELTAQLAESEGLDAAGQERLAADLRQTDPSLWPVVVQSLRAALAYRRKVEREEAAARTAGSGFPGPDHAAGREGSDRVADGGPAQTSRCEPADRAGPGHAELAERQAAEAAPRNGSRRDRSQSRQAGADAAVVQGPETGGKTGGRVVAASYNAPASSVSQDHLAAAISAMEEELRQLPPGEDQAERQARLRLLYLIAGRRNDALKPVPAVSPAIQDFWRQELYGLSVCLDAGRAGDPLRRAGEAKSHLGGAVETLATVAPLEIRNLTFISEVQSYGMLKPFGKYEFTPDQEVLLYAEIENFACDPGPKGFRTAMEGSYLIFDSQGRQVAKHPLGTTEETCRNARRDFFLGYHLRIPKQIYAGTHSLQLTVTDLVSKKVAQASIEFTVKEPKN